MEWRSPQISHFPKGYDLFSLFQISLENFFDVKFRLWKEHNLSLDWIEEIPFYEYQIWVDKLNELIEKQNQDSIEKDGKKQVFSFSK